MRSKDTELLERIKTYVEEYCDDYGCGPTVRDVADALGINYSRAQSYLAALREEGQLNASDHNHYESIHFDRDTTSVDLVGSISCGPLSEAQQQNRGYIRLPRSFVGQGSFFFLEARGDSMIDAGIEEGDLILVRKQRTAENGQIVVALVENETTLKRLKYDAKKCRYYLHPENGAYEDMYVEQLEIQGVVSKIIKEPK